jgi:hypothetical protein
LKEKKALAGLGFLTVTAGGDFHPALRTIQFARILVAKPVPTFAEYARPSDLDDLMELCPSAEAAASTFPSGIRMDPMTPEPDSEGRLGSQTPAEFQRPIRTGKN